MSILAWIITGAAVGGILCVLVGLFYLANYFYRSRKLSKLSQRPPKNKRKRKKWKRAQANLRKQRKKALVLGVLFLLMASGFGGAAGYTSYYQSINLSSDDSALVVRSYYLLRDFQGELEKAADETEDQTAVQQNIRYLATNMAAYSTKKASTLNTKEGQSTLNRYYSALSELGVNAARVGNNFYGNKELVSEFQADIEKTIVHEGKAFEYFKVNQSALTEEGASENE